MMGGKFFLRLLLLLCCIYIFFIGCDDAKKQLIDKYPHFDKFVSTCEREIIKDKNYIVDDSDTLTFTAELGSSSSSSREYDISRGNVIATTTTTTYGHWSGYPTRAVLYFGDDYVVQVYFFASNNGHEGSSDYFMSTGLGKVSGAKKPRIDILFKKVCPSAYNQYKDYMPKEW